MNNFSWSSLVSYLNLLEFFEILLLHLLCTTKNILKCEIYSISQAVCTVYIILVPRLQSRFSHPSVHFQTQTDRISIAVKYFHSSYSLFNVSMSHLSLISLFVCVQMSLMFKSLFSFENHTNFRHFIFDIHSSKGRRGE